MKIFAKNTDKFDVLVLGLYLGEDVKDEDVSKAVKRDKFEGNFGASYVFNSSDKRVLVMGLGKKESFDQCKLREIMAKAQKLLTTLKAETVKIDVETTLSDDVFAEFASIGLVTGEYSFDKYRNKKSPKTIKEVYLNVSSQDAVDKGVKIAEATSFARNLSNEPAQFITPETLSKIASELEGIETKIYDRDEIEKMGMTAYLAVGQGSINTPKFIHMHYKPQNAKKVIALIGKGITFDSGGMDLKPPASMLTMRDDMSGAACVIAVMKLLNEFKPDIEVHGIVAACENMISGKAYKPGDIITAKNGKTIEVENTDAEGRITLADALCYACELGVEEIIDIATLTGACMVALGSQCAGLLGNNKELMDKIQKVADYQGERFWQLPMFPEYFEMLKSDVADMKNTGGRWGGASSAGTFLQEFVNPEIAWAHLDIAGTAFLDKPQKDLIKGATGIGVRTLINYILGEK